MGLRTQHFRTSDELQKYAYAQSIAKETADFLSNFIKSGMSAVDIKNAAETFMKNRKVDSFWYYGVGALVLVGEQTTLSMSGKHYKVSDQKVKQNDLVTVDLSPEIDGIWGDTARSFVVQNGEVVEAGLSKLPEIAKGMKTEMELHESFKIITKPDITFEEAYVAMNSFIEKSGFENLDFNKNLGHSIEKHIDDRMFIEPGNMTEFRDVELFTFEPHIKMIGGKYGFKHENIYYFHQGKLQEL